MNTNSKRSDNERRLFLKAAGVSISLPRLESLAAPAPKGDEEPMRMVCISSALGMNPEAFIPMSFERDHELSPNRRNHIIFRCGGKAMVYDGQPTRTIQIPGRYKITVTAAGVDRDSYSVRFAPVEGPVVMGFGVKQDGAASVSSQAKVLKTFELKDDIDQIFQFDVWIDKGYFPYFSFVNGSSKPITQVRANVRRRKIDRSELRKPYRGPGIRISEFRVEGPILDEWPPTSIRTTYDSDQMPNLADPTVREDVVLRFANRAFRRPVTKKEVAPYLDFLNKQSARTGFRQKSLSNNALPAKSNPANSGEFHYGVWHNATIRTFAAMMSSVDFLYIREGKGELDAYALANRLSYFLWSTMPDSELFALAKSGKLKQPAVLRQQITRLLADERSTQFCNSFADQWLSLDKLGSMPPDAKEFRPYYADNLEPAMLEETRRFFRHVLQDNRSVREFIDSDYSFINKGLAKLYGISVVDFARNPANNEASNNQRPGILANSTTDEFIRVTFPPDSKRGGLLGHGSILTLTANGGETSPVERGVWVLANLLGTPPPPPPKEVPAVTPDLNGAETVRDLLEKHRSDKACLECHRRMDPLGFALEAYDPIGRFRTRYSRRQSVSTEGNYLGQDFADADELKRILVSDNTLLIFTSDNGPVARFGGTTGGLRGGKRSDHEGGIRVPGVARWPGHIEPGTVSDVPVVGTDIFATVLDITGIPLPADRTIDGVSMVPAFSGKHVQRKVPLFWRTHVSPPADRVALRIGDWKLVGDETLTKFQLFEIQKDWKEEHDLTASMPEKTKAMKERLFDVWKQIESEGPDHWWKSERQKPVRGGKVNY